MYLVSLLSAPASLCVTQLRSPRLRGSRLTPSKSKLPHHPSDRSGPAVLIVAANLADDLRLEHHVPTRSPPQQIRRDPLWPSAEVDPCSRPLSAAGSTPRAAEVIRTFWSVRKASPRDPACVAQQVTQRRPLSLASAEVPDIRPDCSTSTIGRHRGTKTSSHFSPQ
jgi:hypothetical protein